MKQEKLTPAQHRRAAAKTMVAGGMVLPQEPSFDQALYLLGTAMLNPKIKAAMNRDEPRTDAALAQQIQRDEVDLNRAFKPSVAAHANAPLINMGQASRPPVAPPAESAAERDRTNAADTMTNLDKVHSQIKDLKAQIRATDYQLDEYHPLLGKLMNLTNDYTGLVRHLLSLTP